MWGDLCEARGIQEMFIEDLRGSRSIRRVATGNKVLLKGDINDPGNGCV